MLKKKQTRILIVGSGVAGRDVLKEIKKYASLSFAVVGFIDDNPKRVGIRIEGVPVLGGRKDIPKVVKKRHVDEIIIAIPSAHGNDIREIATICATHHIRSRIVPRVKEIIEGKALFTNIRPVEVEDLLGRPVTKTNAKELRLFLNEKKVLVTGAAGSIGSELSRQICALRPKMLIALDWWENGMFALKNELSTNYPRMSVHYEIANVQQKAKLNAILRKYTPDFIFHAAAYKHVPLMEEHPDEAIRNNILATKSLVAIAKKTKVERFVFVSTDKAADPSSVMGATKLIAEKITLAENGLMRCMVVRFGNVLNSEGSVVPLFKSQIQLGGPVTITDRKMTRYFMTIPESVNLILNAAHAGKGGELFVLDMGKPIRIIELAKNLIRLSGLTPHKDIAILETGKRKGEKISELLFTKQEELSATKKERILIARSKRVAKKELRVFIKKVATLLQGDEKRKIASLLMRFSKTISS